VNWAILSQSKVNMSVDRFGSFAPLNGVRVIEFGQIAAGPFAGSLLADLGADVVKVENPVGGDGMRNWPPLTAGTADEVFSENFASINRNKRSITANIKNPADVGRLLRLAAHADVVIENFRPGALARAGLSFSEFANVNPQIVYCSISGYGQTGPFSSRGAFDVTVQAFSGLMSVTGREDAPPVKCGVPVADFCAGLYAAYSILAALLRARQTGIGAEIDCSMLGAMLGVSALQTSEFFGTGRAPAALGSAHPRNAPYQAFRSRDGYFVIAAGNDALWSQVAEAVGQPELALDPRFLTQADRARHQDQLRELLEERFATASAAEWIAEMDRRGVPSSPINNFEEALSDPHVQAMGVVQALELPNGATTRTVTFPVTISGWKSAIRRMPPRLGEHDGDIDREWIDIGSRESSNIGAPGR
jgi:succinate---hydroxymethylglutarate CoA-transferase